jgi:hypothetical protein
MKNFADCIRRTFRRSFDWLSRKTQRSKSKRAKQIVVADAVYVELVSAAEFPANREINREKRKIGADAATRSSLNAVTTELFREIPCEN